jgi:Phosphoribosyl-AMP cyclohydrolase
MTATENTDWLNDIRWDHEGLIPAIAQDCDSGKVLTLAWMNRDALLQTVKRGKAVYWSRSRRRLWQKGERSGHTQEIRNIYLDCDRDAIVLEVMQTGGIACHTGRQSCFYHRLENEQWIAAEPVLKNPVDIYGDE